MKLNKTCIAKWNSKKIHVFTYLLKSIMRNGILLERKSKKTKLGEKSLQKHDENYTCFNEYPG